MSFQNVRLPFKKGELEHMYYRVSNFTFWNKTEYKLLLSIHILFDFDYAWVIVVKMFYRISWLNYQMLLYTFATSEFKDIFRTIFTKSWRKISFLFLTDFLTYNLMVFQRRNFTVIFNVILYINLVIICDIFQIKLIVAILLLFSWKINSTISFLVNAILTVDYAVLSIYYVIVT